MTDHYERERELYEAKMRQKHGLSPYFEQENLQEPFVMYAVLAYYDYYPDGDNVKGVFDSYSKAEQFLDKFRKERDHYDFYKIVDYVLNQET